MAGITRRFMESVLDGVFQDWFPPEQLKSAIKGRLKIRLGKGLIWIVLTGTKDGDDFTYQSWGPFKIAETPEITLDEIQFVQELILKGE